MNVSHAYGVAPSFADGVALVRAALDMGVQMLDTATLYGNEREVGQAIRDSGLHRDDVFVTTKIPSDGVGRERQVLEASLAALGTGHVDLWLIHWPPSAPGDSVKMWRQVLRARDEGWSAPPG